LDAAHAGLLLKAEMEIVAADCPDIFWNVARLEVGLGKTLSGK
jgi:hypothetical protein